MARSDASESDIDASSDASEVEDLLLSSPTKGKGKGKGKAGKEEDADQESRTIVQTAFDAYFLYSATKMKAKGAASSSMFSALVQPLSAEEYAEAVANLGDQEKRVEPSIVGDPEARAALFERLMSELHAGFNALCYGFGSKRALLNEFATTRCAKRGHVVVVNGWHPEVALRDILGSIENNVDGVADLPLPANTPDGQARRIFDFFSSAGATTKQKQKQRRKSRDLYLVIHNIDSLLVRAPKAKASLSLLALHPRIHLVASVDHINAPLLWSASEGAARKAEVDVGGNGGDRRGEGRRGFAWLWHDVTTLAPYDTELAFADRTSITGAHARRGRGDAGAAAGAAGVGAAGLSDTAVRHVLAAVTDKAKALFALMGKRQLASIEADGSDPPADALQPHGVSYDVLFPLAQREFIATQDTQLKAQLGEFRDHGLVVGAQAGVGGGEVLWIPMRKERLARILASI